MELIYTLFFLLVCYSMLYRFPVFALPGISDKWIFIAFSVKLLAAFVLILIYTFYYPDRSDADIYKYYDDANALFHAFWMSPKSIIDFVQYGETDGEIGLFFRETVWHWRRYHSDIMFNDNRTIITILFFMMFITLGYYVPTVILVVFLAFVGLLLLYRFFTSYMHGKEAYIFLILFFLPSVLLWTSGILKESFLILFVGMFFTGIQFIFSKKNRGWILFIVGLLGLVFLKYYVFLSLLPGCILWVWHRKYASLSLSIKSIVVFGGCLLLIVLNHYVFHFYPLVKAITLKHNDFVRWVETLGGVGSYIDSEFYEPTLLSLMSHVPEALFNVLFRPLPWNISNSMMLIPALETCLTVCLLFFILLRRDISKRINSHILLSISFVVLLFTISGLVSPVVGALVRYKVPALPFLYTAILYFIDTERIPLHSIINKYK